ncbi:MAG: hypothetical protein ACI37Q_05300 [Candidatus Gastranaerophilaceae bacterium]
MKENSEIEKLLLNDAKYDNLVRSKIEKEFEKETGNKKIKSKIITDIKKVPKDMIFTKNAIFLIMNKMSKTKSYINGVQAEGFLGVQNTVRENLLNGNTDSFVAGNNFVKFVKAFI